MILSFLLIGKIVAVPCFLLQNSIQCPAQNQLAIQATSAYSDTASFDNFVSTRLDNNTAYIQEFNSTFSCPQYAGLGQQFHLSIFCSLLTQQPKNCDNPVADGAQRVPLCKDTCTAAQNSLQSVFAGSSCDQNPNQSASSQRQGTLKAYGDFCNTLTVQNPSVGKCLDGSTQPQEQYTCGFSTLAEGQAFCQSSPTARNTPCCSNLGGTTSSQSQQQSPLTSSALFIGLLALGIIVFLITLFFSFKWAMAKRSDPPGNDITIVHDKHSSVRTSSIRNSTPNSSSNQPIMKVIAAYDSRMVDELTLRPGDRIQMMESYDDGWAYGLKLGTSDVGSFPLVTTVLETEG